MHHIVKLPIIVTVAEVGLIHFKAEKKCNLTEQTFKLQKQFKNTSVIMNTTTSVLPEFG